MVRQSQSGKVLKPPPLEDNRSVLLCWFAFQRKTTFSSICWCFAGLEIVNKRDQVFQISSGVNESSMKHTWRQTVQVTCWILRFVKQFTAAHIRHTTATQKASFCCWYELFPDLVPQTSEIAKDNCFLLNNWKNDIFQPRISKSRFKLKKPLWW